MLSFSIAVRFLRKSPVQSILIAAGIAVGIGVQVFLGSLIIGLQDSLVEQTIGSSPQVTVQAKEQGSPVDYTTQVKDAIAAQSQITTQVPVRQFSAILKQGADTVPLQLTGGDLAQLDTIYDLSGKVVSGTASLTGPDIVLGNDLAEKYAIKPGQTLSLVLPNGKPIDERLAATVDFGSSQANLSLGFTSAEVAQQVLGYTGDQYSEIQAQVTNVFDSVQVADSLQAEPALQGLKVTEWQAENQDLLSALQSQSSSSYTIQFFVLVAVALGIASTLAISAVQKTRQIGILKAMGMRDRQAGRIFLWQAALLGLCGAGAGVIVGVGLISLFSLTGGSLTFGPKPGFTAISFVVGVLVALASSLIPSRRTSKLDPIEVIQGG
jgi:lipoprotein-releasing system permease protein